MGEFYNIDKEVIDSLEITGNEERAFDRAQRGVPRWFFSVEKPEFMRLPENTLIVSWEKGSWRISFIIEDTGQYGLDTLQQIGEDGSVTHEYYDLPYILMFSDELDFTFTKEELLFSDIALGRYPSPREVEYAKAKINFLVSQEFKQLAWNLKKFDQYDVNEYADAEALLKVNVALLGNGMGLNNLRVILDKLEGVGNSMNAYYDSLK